MDKTSIKNRINRAEEFLLRCSEGGLARSYDVVTNVWCKPYPEVTGYLLSYFSKTHSILPPQIITATDHLVSIQSPNGGFKSFYDNSPLFSFDTFQILHGLLSVYLKTKKTKYLEASIKCLYFLESMQKSDGSMYCIYDTNRNLKIDEYAGFYQGQTRHSIQCKNIEGLLLAYNALGEKKYKAMADNLYNFCIKSDYNISTHPLGYYLEGLLAYGSTENVKKLLLEIVVPQIRDNGFLPYSKGLQYAYVSGSVQIAILLYKSDLKEYSFRILEWANRVQDNHKCGGLFQYANEDGSLNNAVHTEINSWGTKYFCELNRILLCDAKMEKKDKAELDFWEKLYQDFVKECDNEECKKQKCLDISWHTTFPRYKKDLYLETNSFYGMKVLDVGCGANGGLIGFENCDKYAIDHLYDEYVRIGYPLHEHGIKYVNGKSENLPYDSNFFDVIVCVNALDHVDSLDATVKQISRVLKKGGVFLAQLNFRVKPSLCEPIVFEHNALKILFESCSMLVEEVKFQYTQGKTEDRFYYRVRKV